MQSAFVFAHFELASGTMDVHRDSTASSSSADIPSLVALDGDVLPRLELNDSGARQVVPTDAPETTSIRTPAKAADVDTTRDELPCTCCASHHVKSPYPNRVIYRSLVGDRQGWKQARVGAGKEMMFNSVLPPIKTEIRRAIEAANALITLLQQYHDPQNEETSTLSLAEFRERLLAQRMVVLRVG